MGDSTTVHQTCGSKRHTVKEISQLGKKIEDSDGRQLSLWQALAHTYYYNVPSCRMEARTVLTEITPPHSFVTGILERSCTR